MGAGCLKWAPDVAWHSLMVDILEAYEGHKDELKAIHGEAEATDEDAPRVPATDENLKAAFRGMMRKH